MRKQILTVFILFSSFTFFSQETIITSDLDNFWIAYDKITSTKDSAQQYAYLNEFFLEKGTPGLKAIMEVRGYEAKEYIEAINNYPLFWASIRPNMLKAKEYAKEIEADIAKIKTIYPELKPAKIYFTVGAFRTGGTTLEDMVLIGSEITMADETTVTSEFPDYMSNLGNYFNTNPIKNIAFGNVHEYVHTQQKTTIGDNLLAQCLLEGIAEFTAVQATGKKTTLPALAYGRKNNISIRDKFALQMFNSITGFWLYSNENNEFDNTRDLGYYVGYAICEKYYSESKDKKAAIKRMIEMDYNNPKELEKFIDETHYFSSSCAKIKKEFNKKRPKVLKISQFKNGSQEVDPNLKELTIEFSEPMNEDYRNFQFGELGEEHVVRITKFVGFSEDKKSVTFEIELKPDHRHQIIVGSGFIKLEKPELSLEPYLIDFKTTK